MENKDVIVVGGGPSGIGASIGAARAGANVLLIERYGFLGGMATAGLVNHWDPILLMEISGVARELYDEMKKNKYRIKGSDLLDWRKRSHMDA